MIRNIALKFLPISMLASLAGCTYTPIQEDGFSYVERHTQLETISAWEMNGRIMVDTGERAFQGRFRWARVEENGKNPLPYRTLLNSSA